MSVPKVPKKKFLVSATPDLVAKLDEASENLSIPRSTLATYIVGDWLSSRGYGDSIESLTYKMLVRDKTPKESY